MTMAVLDREEVEQSLALLESAGSSDPAVKEAVEKLRHALRKADGQELLTTAQAAEALGIRSVNTIKYWCKTGYLHGVRRGERMMIPLAEIDRIKSGDRVRTMSTVDRLHEETRGPGDAGDLGDEELRSLKASRPGKAPWET